MNCSHNKLNESKLFKPLVVGAPRTGFALLCSIISNFTPLCRSKITLRQRMLNTVIDMFGDHISNSIVHVFSEHGITDDLIYNASFRKLAGGPKWLDKRTGNKACFRKYVGVRGMGDFTLITSHPREVLDYDEMVHSHVDPKYWLEHPGYSDYCKFASIRNPIGAINSSLFSLNALASEYIQRFVPPEDDNDAMRQHLALFKFTNMDFFEGIAKFYKSYLDEFMVVRDKYHLMRWEDLMLNPAETISQLANSAGIPVDIGFAGEIWGRLNHVNLTGSHKHNFRKGGGEVGGWRKWMTNRHLDVMRDFGFEPHIRALGYGDIPRLDESDYTPFQREVDALIQRGEVFEDFPDQDLFGFAFNKSNMDSSKFPFHRYEWREHTQVERSCFTDEKLMYKVWDVAEEATKRINMVFDAVLDGSYDNETEAIASLTQIKNGAGGLKEHMPKAYEAAFPALKQVIHGWFGSIQNGLIDDGHAPKLIRSFRQYNLVSYKDHYYGILQSAGPMNLAEISLKHVAGVIESGSFQETQTAILNAEQ